MTLRCFFCDVTNSVLSSQIRNKNLIFQNSQISKWDPPDDIVKLRDTKLFRYKFERRTNFFPNSQTSNFKTQ